VAQNWRRKMTPARSGTAGSWAASIRQGIASGVALYRVPWWVMEPYSSLRQSAAMLGSRKPLIQPGTSTAGP
jgi:hypothetical protein